MSTTKSGTIKHGRRELYNVRPKYSRNGVISRYSNGKHGEITSSKDKTLELPSKFQRSLESILTLFVKLSIRLK